MNEDCDSRRPDNSDTGPCDPEPDERLLLEIVLETGDWPDIGALRALARRVCREVVADGLTGDEKLEATLAFSSDSRVRDLNQQFRGKDMPTNILSFPAPEPLNSAFLDEAGYLGDIVIARETIEREAAEQAIPFEHHFAHLVAHGLLHLLGYDHETDEGAEKMESAETRVLARLGIPDPYPTEEESVGPSA